MSLYVNLCHNPQETGENCGPFDLVGSETNQLQVLRGKKKKRRGPIPGEYTCRQAATALPAPVQTEGNWSKQGQGCYHPTTGVIRSLIGLVVSWKFANSPSKRA